MLIEVRPVVIDRRQIILAFKGMGVGSAGIVTHRWAGDGGS